VDRCRRLRPARDDVTEPVEKGPTIRDIYDREHSNQGEERWKERPSRLDRYRRTRYVHGMKLKTSITLEEETVAALDREAGGTTNRSRLIEQAILEFLDRRRRAARDARDLHLINRNAQELNDEMADVLDYQVRL
jgi:predicted transcriptional regulator